MNVFLILLPDFAVIALGALAGPLLPKAGWQAIDRLSYHVLYPALLFGAAAARPIVPRELLVVGGLACVVITLGFLLSLGVSRFGPTVRVERAGALQNGWRFNTALGFVAVAALPPEAVGTLAVMVGLGIPLANLYAVILLALGQTLSPWRLFREVTSNPFLLASLAGVAVGLGGRALPAIPATFVDRLADAALPIVLLSLGAALRGTRVRPPTRFALALHAIRLLVLPGAVWGIATLTDTNGTVAATLLIFAALPTATVAHVLAARYGADRGAVALLVMQSSLLGLATLPLWSLVATRLAAS